MSRSACFMVLKWKSWMLCMLKIHIQGGQTVLSNDKVSVSLGDEEEIGISLISHMTVNLA